MLKIALQKGERVTRRCEAICRAQRRRFDYIGRKDLKKAKIAQLLKCAQSEGWLSELEVNEILALGKLRNPLVHFREPLDIDRPDIRALPFGKNAYAVLEQDAKKVLVAAVNILQKTSI